MTATCWTPVRGKIVRATRVDACGAPPAALTANAQVTSSGFVSVEFSPDYEDGDDLTQKTADGTLCVADRGCDQLKRVGVTVTFCGVDPDMLGLVAGLPAEVDVSGVNVGFRLRSGQPCTDFALEVWAGTPGLQCGANEIQTLTEGGAGLTTFTLTFAGQTTAAITASSTAANVQSKLEALSNIGPGNVVVTGPAGASTGPWVVTFTGTLAGTNVAQMTSTPTGGTGTLTVATFSGGTGVGQTYGYLLVPHLKNGRLNDWTIENGVTTFEVEAWTSGQVGWLKGPYNVVASGAAGVPSELDDAILANDHVLMRTTTVAPPAAVCGYQALPATPTVAL